MIEEQSIDNWGEVIEKFTPSANKETPSLGDDNFYAVWSILDNLIVNKFGNWKHKRSVLDFGCGVGTLANRLGCSGWNVVACDPSKQMIMKAKIQIQNPNIKILCGGIDCVIDSGPFNLITAVMVFQFIENIEETIKPLFNELCEGGIILIAVHHPKHFLKCIQNKIKFFDFDSTILPSAGKIQISDKLFKIFIRSEEWYDQRFESIGAARIAFDINHSAVEEQFLTELNEEQSGDQKYLILCYEKPFKK